MKLLRNLTGLVLSGAVFVGCAGAARGIAVPSPRVTVEGHERPAAPFITTFWCGPPLEQFDDRRAAEIAAAGFSIVGPPCEGQFDPAAQLAALDVAARHGLKVWVADPRFSVRVHTLPDWEGEMAAAVGLYRSHEALGGYFVADEPTTALFDDLAAIVERLRALDPDHIAYINLPADYVPGLGVSTYREYVERFVATVHPAILSYDYYPFTVTGVRESFFSNLAVMRELSLRYDVPFMLIVQAMPHAVYRDPTEAELSWQVLHALAYGAQGVSYFAYWTPENVQYQDIMRFRHGLIDRGLATEHYGQAMRLNGELKSVTRELEGFRSIAVVDSTGRTSALSGSVLVGLPEGGAPTIGVFEDRHGRRLLLLVNRGYRHDTGFILESVSDLLSPTQRFDAHTGRWRPLASGRVNLAAGAAVLLR